MTRVAVPSLERFLAQATEFRGKGKFCRRFRQKRGNLGVDTGMAPILAILRGSLSQPKEKVGCPGFLDLEPAGWRQVLQIIDRGGWVGYWGGMGGWRVGGVQLHATVCQHHRRLLSSGR